MIQNLPHREEVFASFLMKIFACLSPAKVAAVKPTQLCTFCENLFFIMIKFTFSPPINTRTKLLTSKK